MFLFFNTLFVFCSSFSTKRYIPKSNLAIFGVTGKTGKCVLQQASSMNKGVFSLVRPKNMVETDESHTVYYGDVTSLDDVKQVYDGNVIYWNNYMFRWSNLKSWRYYVNRRYKKYY
ncbi:MAG: hypothetical protein Ct9H90mP28_6480 [Paracoccaceae bacterium]|nr:MAG: hypothetical protein Ct9H90mP28_6480 [Paracoccaceae bacterium]